MASSDQFRIIFTQNFLNIALFNINVTMSVLMCQVGTKTRMATMATTGARSVHAGTDSRMVPHSLPVTSSGAVSIWLTAPSSIPKTDTISVIVTHFHFRTYKCSL